MTTLRTDRNPNAYHFYNRRRDGKRISDCVTRAISTATGLKYNGVRNLLKITAELYACPELCLCCYQHLLTDILCYKKVECHNEETVEGIARQYPRDKVIIRIEGHLSASVYGEVTDIWDCSQKLVDCYWIVD